MRKNYRKLKLDMRKNLICICKWISFWSKCANTLPYRRNFSKTLCQVREQTHRFYQMFSHFFSCCNSIFWCFAPFEFGSTLAIAYILFWYPIWLLRVAIVKLESRRLHYYLFQVIFLNLRLMSRLSTLYGPTLHCYKMCYYLVTQISLPSPSFSKSSTF